MYPRLDPGDDNDPTERINILAMLSPAPGAFNDPIMFISKFRTLRLVPALPYTLRDHLISINEFEAADGQAFTPDLIVGEIMRLPPEEAEKQAALAAELKQTVEALCAAADEKMSGGYGLNMSSLLAEINKLCKFFAGFVHSLNDSAGADSENAGDGAASPSDGVSGGASGGGFNLAAFRPANRVDALLMLRKGAEYFQHQEPNSPIPLLVNRALRFSEMSFVDLLEDIVPDALSQGKKILGVRES